MRMYDLIRKKRDGLALTGPEIAFFGSHNRDRPEPAHPLCDRGIKRGALGTGAGGKRRIFNTLSCEARFSGELPRSGKRGLFAREKAPCLNRVLSRQTPQGKQNANVPASRLAPTIAIARNRRTPSATAVMRMYDLIRKKRDGLALTGPEIAFFVDGYVRGEIPDYQVAASFLLMIDEAISGRLSTVAVTSRRA